MEFLKTDEQKLFELVDSIGEILKGDLHIIDNTEEHIFEDGKKYRVYHKEGYCWDISKKVESEDPKTGEMTYYYSFLEEWDGFKKSKSISEVITRIALAAESHVDQKSFCIQKHTPGEWSLKKRESLLFNSYWVQSDNQICIAEMPSYSLKGINKEVIAEEYKANAKLISSSPDMLKALYEAKSLIERMKTVLLITEPFNEEIKINEAIKKATE